MKTYSMPMPQRGTNQPTTIGVGQSVMIVGANGAGKTRLGAWIEKNVKRKEVGIGLNPVQRIAAQKSLKMPNYSRPISMGAADIMLRTGLRETDLAHYSDSGALGLKRLFDNRFVTEQK